jgi:hypothetical protein
MKYKQISLQFALSVRKFVQMRLDRVDREENSGGAEGNHS